MIDRLSRIAGPLAWVALIGAIVVVVLNQVRLHLGYQPFDSQWSPFGILGLFGLLGLILLAPVQLVVCAVGAVLSLRGHDREKLRQFLRALAISALGYVILVFG